MAMKARFMGTALYSKTQKCRTNDGIFGARIDYRQRRVNGPRAVVHNPFRVDICVRTIYRSSLVQTEMQYVHIKNKIT